MTNTHTCIYSCAYIHVHGHMHEHTQTHEVSLLHVCIPSPIANQTADGAITHPLDGLRDARKLRSIASCESLDDDTPHISGTRGAQCDSACNKISCHDQMTRLTRSLRWCREFRIGAARALRSLTKVEHVAARDSMSLMHCVDKTRASNNETERCMSFVGMIRSLDVRDLHEGIGSRDRRGARYAAALPRRVHMYGSRMDVLGQ